MNESLLNTVTQGNPHGEALFVFHGWAMSSFVWQAVKIELEKDFLVTWVDLPGYGVNTHITADSLAQIVDLILPLIKTKSHLMGWSLGGLVAQALAEKLPEQIYSLTLVASTPRFSQSSNWLNAMRAEDLESFSKNFQTEPDLTIKHFIALQFMGVKEAKKIQRDLITTILAKPPCHKALSTGLTILASADFCNAKLAMPQHWIFAEHDRLIPQSVIKDLKLIHPDAQITLLENAGHAPFMTHPHEFMHGFRKFIASLETNASC